MRSRGDIKSISTNSVTALTCAGTKKPERIAAIALGFKAVEPVSGGVRSRSKSHGAYKLMRSSARAFHLA